MAKKTYYEILGVAESADAKAIKAAYRTLSKRLHPDFGGSQKAFAEVAEAADVLTDPEKRESYDRELRHQRARAPKRPTGTAAPRTRTAYEPPPPPEPPKLIVPCPQCGTKNRVLDLPVIKQAKCGKCGTAFPIERPEPDSWGKIFADLVSEARDAGVSSVLSAANERLRKFNDAAKDYLDKKETAAKAPQGDEPRASDPEDPASRAEDRLREFDSWADKLK